jgi:hypothetical protein
LLLIAERVGVVSEQLEVLLKPTITHEPMPMPEIGPLPTTEELIEQELEETNGDD